VERRIVNPWTWQEQLGYEQAVEVTGGERTLFCAGQVSVDAEGNPLHEGDLTAQALQAIDNLETVLREAGFELADVARLNYYVTDIDAFFEAGPALGKRLGEAGCRASGTLLGVARLGFPQLLIEVEATAVR
jgi:enamine deaminase RidA (YjgF/YER057c/UK114 family)